MKKKVMLLSIFSLVLLFALHGTTYAYSYEITTENVDELFTYYNSNWYNSIAIGTLKSRTYTSLNTWQNEYTNCILRVDNLTNGRHTMYIYYFNNNEVTLNYFNSGTSWKISGTIKRYDVTGNAYANMSQATADTNSKTQYTMIRNDIGTIDAPYQNIEIMTLIQPEQQFEFIPESTNTVNVQGLTQTFYTIQKEAVTSKLLGKLYKSRLTEGIYSDFYIYNTYSNSWDYLNERVVYNKTDGYIDEFFNTDKTHDYWISDIYIKNNIIAPNIFFRYQFYPMNADFDDYIDIWFYVTDTNTKYNNGVISPALTFSGDYLEQYKEITGQLSEAIEEQKIQDKITDVNDTLTDNSQIDNIIAENLSGDNLMDSLGYSPLENPFTTIILNTMEDFTEALLDSGNETLTFTIFNNTITIHSEDFTLPNGNLKNFISLMCNAFVVYELIKYGFKLYQWINSGRLQNLVNETNNHQYYLF